jgi:hypothetical protein
MKTVEKLPRKGRKRADWRESVGNVLKSVDAQLAAFGLEIVQENTLEDSYHWVIVKKPGHKKKGTRC